MGNIKQKNESENAGQPGSQLLKLKTDTETFKSYIFKQ